MCLTLPVDEVGDEVVSRAGERRRVALVMGMGGRHLKY